MLICQYANIFTVYVCMCTCSPIHTCVCDTFSSDIWTNAHITQDIYIVFLWVWARQGSCWFYPSLGIFKLKSKNNWWDSSQLHIPIMYVYLYINITTTQTALDITKYAEIQSRKLWGVKPFPWYVPNYVTSSFRVLKLFTNWHHLSKNLPIAQK